MTDYVEYRYTAPTHSHPDIALAILKLISQQLSNGTVCELGCGSGWLCHRLAEAGYAAYGVDLSESGIRAARSAKINGADFALQSIDAELAQRINLHRQCDLVLSNDVIEHLYRPADLLEAARGLLKPGGILLIATPYHGYMKNLAIAALGKSDQHYNPLWDGGHIKFFSQATLTQLLHQHDFMPREYEHVGRFYAFWKSMISVSTIS